jgi:hypothetical protein
VTSRWQNRQLAPSGRKERKSAIALSYRIGTSSPRSANGRELSKKQSGDSLPPSQVRSRVTSSRNIKIHKHFVPALTPSPTRAPMSQPNPDSKIALLNKFNTSLDRRGRETFSSAISLRKTGCRVWLAEHLATTRRNLRATLSFVLPLGARNGRSSPRCSTIADAPACAGAGRGSRPPHRITTA